MIFLRTSRTMGCLVRAGEAVDKLVDTADGVQWMRVPEWSLGPLSATSTDQYRFYDHLGVFLVTH